MYTSLNRNAANVYKQMGVQSVVDGASPHTLIQLLFDALEASLNAAKGAMQRGDVDEKGRQIGKAVRILEEGLKAALNQEQDAYAPALILTRQRMTAATRQPVFRHLLTRSTLMLRHSHHVLHLPTWDAIRLPSLLQALQQLQTTALRV